MLWRSTIKNHKTVFLTDSLIKLHPARPDEAEEMYAAIRESIAEISPWLQFAHNGYSLNESRDFLKGCPQNWKKDIEYVFSITDARDGTYIGNCGLNRMDTDNRRANLGYWIRTSRTGQGIAAAATVLLAKWGFQELRLRRIEIIVATGNTRSQRVAEKAGAYREGILRDRIKINERMHDAVMYSLLPGDI